MCSGQPSTGVELRKKMNDDFQDFIDFVDPIIKNPSASNEGNMPHIICDMNNAVVVKNRHL